MFLAHGDPGVGDEDVGVVDGLFWYIGGGQSSWCGSRVGGGADEGEHGGGDGVGLRGGDGDVDAEFKGGESEVVSMLLARTHAIVRVDR